MSNVYLVGEAFRGKEQNNFPARIGHVSLFGLFACAA